MVVGSQEQFDCLLMVRSKRKHRMRCPGVDLRQMSLPAERQPRVVYHFFERAVRLVGRVAIAVVMYTDKSRN